MSFGWSPTQTRVRSGVNGTLFTRCSEVGIAPRSGRGDRWFKSSHLDFRWIFFNNWVSAPLERTTKTNLRSTSGPIAHLEERFNGIEEARGSTPLGSTNAPVAQSRAASLYLAYALD